MFFERIRHSYDLPLSNEPSQSKNRQQISSEKVTVYLDGFSPIYAMDLKIEKIPNVSQTFMSVGKWFLMLIDDSYDAKYPLYVPYAPYICFW